MDEAPVDKWYYRRSSVIIALLAMGPFAFPFLYKSPRFSRTWKAGLTIAVLALTIWLAYLSKEMYDQLMTRLNEALRAAGI